ncbi:hypothetical protein [Streptomyces sp. NPDC001137]
MLFDFTHGHDGERLGPLVREFVEERLEAYVDGLLRRYGVSVP